MENQELKIRIYHPEEEAFGNSDVRINHCAPAGRSSRRTPSCGPLRAEAPARAAPRCRRALEYLSHRLFCCPSIGQLAAGGRCFPSRRDEVQPSAPGGCGLPLFDQWNEKSSLRAAHNRLRLAKFRSSTSATVRCGCRHRRAPARSDNRRGRPSSKAPRRPGGHRRAIAYRAYRP